MMETRRCVVGLLLVLVTTAVACGLAVGQELPGGQEAVTEPAKESPPREFAEYLKLAAEMEPGDVRLWDALMKAPFVLNSDTHPNFHFEFFQSVPSKTAGESTTRFVRALVESRDAHAAMLVLADDLPNAGLVDGHIFVLREETGHWKFLAARRWGLILEGPTIQRESFFDVPPADAQRDWIVGFESSSLLKEITRDRKLDVRWDSVARTMVVRKPNGTTIHVRFRSPQDELRYGTSLAEVWIQSSNGGVVCLRAFDRSKQSEIRLRISDGKVLVEELNATESVADSDKEATAPVNRSVMRRVAQQLWSAMTGWKAETERVWTRDFLSRNYESLNLIERSLFLYAHSLKGIIAEDADPDEELLMLHGHRVLDVLRDMRAAARRCAC